MSKPAPKWTAEIECHVHQLCDDLCEVTDMDSPAFHELLGQIQDCLDPDRKYDCGGFASVFFCGHDWVELDQSERLGVIERYVTAQRHEIAEPAAWFAEGV